MGKINSLYHQSRSRRCSRQRDPWASITPDQAGLEEADAVAVMALEMYLPTSTKHGGMANRSREMIQGIIRVMTIPVMAKARINHRGRRYWKRWAR